MLASPTLASVAPSQFSGGDVVTVQGTGLSGSALFEVNGAPATVTSGTATTLSVEIPICLAPGQATLRARVAGALTNVITGTNVASSGAVQLAVGDYASIDPAQLPSCATFPAAGLTGAEYLVAPQSVSPVAGDTTSYQVVGDSAGPVAVSPIGEVEPPSAAAAFHDFLRRQEHDISRMPRTTRPSGAAPAAPTAAAPIGLGQQKSFRVCNKIDCTLLADFSKITATAK